MSNDNPTYSAIEKYKKKTYDRIELLVYKGEKQKIKNYASKKGKTKKTPSSVRHRIRCFRHFFLFFIVLFPVEHNMLWYLYCKSCIYMKLNLSLQKDDILYETAE